MKNLFFAAILASFVLFVTGCSDKDDDKPTTGTITVSNTSSEYHIIAVAIINSEKPIPSGTAGWDVFD
ncbi:MAG: hypothetical protein FWF51_07125 [Chitinivibrionia bacterium]|nr:hypothetical protein [Chitinivibrionia bacterium]